MEVTRPLLLRLFYFINRPPWANILSPSVLLYSKLGLTDFDLRMNLLHPVEESKFVKIAKMKILPMPLSMENYPNKL